MTLGCFNRRLGDFCINRNSKIAGTSGKPPIWVIFSWTQCCRTNQCPFREACVYSQPLVLTQTGKYCNLLNKSHTVEASVSVLLSELDSLSSLKEEFSSWTGFGSAVSHKLVWHIRWCHSHQLEALNLLVTGSGVRGEIWLAGFECSRPKIRPAAL